MMRWLIFTLVLAAVASVSVEEHNTNRGLSIGVESPPVEQALWEVEAARDDEDETVMENHDSPVRMLKAKSASAASSSSKSNSAPTLKSTKAPTIKSTKVPTIKSSSIGV